MNRINKPRYQVETMTYCAGWINVWTEENERGEIVPQTFGTRADAEAAIAEFLEEVKAAVEAGDMAEAYHRVDFRVRPARDAQDPDGVC